MTQVPFLIDETYPGVVCPDPPAPKVPRPTGEKPPRPPNPKPQPPRPHSQTQPCWIVGGIDDNDYGTGPGAVHPEPLPRPPPPAAPNPPKGPQGAEPLPGGHDEINRGTYPGVTCPKPPVKPKPPPPKPLKPVPGCTKRLIGTEKVDGSDDGTLPSILGPKPGPIKPAPPPEPPSKPKPHRKKQPPWGSGDIELVEHDGNEEAYSGVVCARPKPKPPPPPPPHKPVPEDTEQLPQYTEGIQLVEHDDNEGAYPGVVCPKPPVKPKPPPPKPLKPVPGCTKRPREEARETCARKLLCSNGSIALEAHSAQHESFMAIAV